MRPAGGRGGRGMSLFARMLWLQALLATVVSVVAVSFYYVERNKTVARILAGQWAGALQTAVAHPGQALPPGVHAVRSQPPPAAMQASALWPQVRALKDALARQGLAVRRVAFEVPETPEATDGEPIVWLEIQAPGQPAPQWWAVRGPLFELSNLYFIGITLGVSAVLVLALSWATSRHLSQPLARLRQRIQEGRPEAEHEQRAPRAPEVADIAQAYDDLLARVEQQRKDRSLMLVGISHDLRSPLSRIRLAAELLPPDEGAVTLRQSIIRNTQVADALIESFMDVVRAGHLPVDETVDVAEQARQVAADVQSDDRVLAVEAPRQALQAGSNAYLVRRLLYNLVDNAFKHGRPPVTLTVRDHEAQGLWIEVMDAGEGIAAHQREAVLQAFARGDGSRSTAGSGLGLTVVQQVIDRVGGALSFDGQPGRWVVRVLLHHKHPEPLSGAPSTPVPTAATRPGERS